MDNNSSEEVERLKNYLLKAFTVGSTDITDLGTIVLLISRTRIIMYITLYKIVIENEIIIIVTYVSRCFKYHADCDKQSSWATFNWANQYCLAQLNSNRVLINIRYAMNGSKAIKRRAFFDMMVAINLYLDIKFSTDKK